MAKVEDYTLSSEMVDIVERLMELYPSIFGHFDVSRLKTIITHSGKPKKPVRVIAMGYPREVFGSCTYIFEAFTSWWNDMNQKQKNLAVFHAMCHIPEGGFDEQSKMYGRIRYPEWAMFSEEFAAAGGVPNWMENPAARDPLDEDEVKRCPVSATDIGDFKISDDDEDQEDV